jgi:serine/threonine protein kinase
VRRLTDQAVLALTTLGGVPGEVLTAIVSELQVLKKLEHPCIGRVLQVDVASAGFLYALNECADGEPIVRAASTWPAEDRLTALAQAARGLAALHALGLCHRHLLPACILTRAAGDGSVRTLLSHACESPSLRPHHQATAGPPANGSSQSTRREGLQLSSSDTGSTAPVPVAGAAEEVVLFAITLRPEVARYMAPEVTGEKRSYVPASDIYSLAVIAHEILDWDRTAADAPGARSILQAALDPDGSRRPSAEALAEGLECAAVEVRRSPRPERKQQS